jgi:hypothetical protein
MNRIRFPKEGKMKKNYMPIVFAGILMMIFLYGCSTFRDSFSNNASSLPPNPEVGQTEPANVQAPSSTVAQSEAAADKTHRDMPAEQPGSDAVNDGKTTLAVLQEAVVNDLPTKAEDDKLVFTYKVRENLDVQVIFENETAYDAVQLGLSLLNKFSDKEYVPGVEEEDFFPKFFAMINVETRDGLLYISEKEAVAFATTMYLEYQRKVMPSERAVQIRKREVVDQDIIPSS